MQQATKRVAIYARSATTQEKGASFATDAQIHACIAYATEHGYEVVEGQIYQETASGNTAQRPGLLAVLAEAEKGAFTILLIYDYNRIARSQHLIEHLISRFTAAGVSVESIQEHFSTQSIMQLLQSFALDEQQKRIAARTMHGRQAARERTKQAPLGITTGEAITVQCIFTMSGEGQPAQEIARQLNKERQS